MNAPEQPDPAQRPVADGLAGSRTPSASDPTDNPYATPLQGTWNDDAENRTAPGRPLQPESVPWHGGWGLAVLVVGLLSGLGVAAAMQLDNGAISGLLIPLGGLLLMAVLVRFLHSTVEVDWPIYLLISAGFGIVSYFAFIPVCFVVGIPIAMVMEPLGISVSATIALVIFAIVMVCGLIFTLLLRLYFRHRYRKQYFGNLAQSAPPASESIVPSDPLAAPRN